MKKIILSIALLMAINPVFAQNQEKQSPVLKTASQQTMIPDYSAGNLDWSPGVLNQWADFYEPDRQIHPMLITSTDPIDFYRKLGGNPSDKATLESVIHLLQAQGWIMTKNVSEYQNRAGNRSFRIGFQRAVPDWVALPPDLSPEKQAACKKALDDWHEALREY